MVQPDLNNLRALLDDYERFADSIMATARLRAVADRMKAAIAEARAGLRPSADGTANYVESKTIVERLAALKEEAGDSSGI
jgi:outer membrane protein TolC